MRQRFVGPEADKQDGVSSRRTVREYRQYRRAALLAAFSDTMPPAQALRPGSATATATRRGGDAPELNRGATARRRSTGWALVPLGVCLLLSVGASRLMPSAFPSARKSVTAPPPLLRYTPAQVAAGTAALKQYQSATALLKAGNDPEAVAALHGVADAPLIIVPRTDFDGRKARTEADPEINTPMTLLQTGSAMTRRARAAADAHDPGTARLWIRQCRGLSGAVLQRAAPSLDSLALAHSLDSFAGNTERKITERQEEIGPGNFDRLILTAMHEQSRKRLWRTQFQPALAAATERRRKAVATAQNLPAGPERDQRVALTIAAQDLLDAEIAADLIALYIAQRPQFAV